MNVYIEQLHNKKWLWQGFQSHHSQQLYSSGYKELDEKLAGGWPEAGVIDIKTMHGIGELRLLLPYLAAQQRKGLLVFIAPPTMISSEFLAGFAIDLTQVLLIDVTKEDALWCAEQCLKSGCCSSVLLWQQTLAIHQSRRLTLAAEQGEANLFIIRQTEYSAFNLPVALSLRLLPDEQGIKVAIDKRKGGRSSAPFTVNMRLLWPELVKDDLPNNVVKLGTHSHSINAG